MALIYLLLFASPQLLVFLYLRERLPLSARRWLAVVFTVFNTPWVIVAVRMFSGSLWGISRPGEPAEAHVEEGKQKRPKPHGGNRDPEQAGPHDRAVEP